jgi:hypothetical protein
MRRKVKLLTICALLFVFTSRAWAGMPAHEAAWDNEALPTLDRYCFKCHAGVRQKSGLDLRSLDTILRGGERGPAVIPGKPEESRLLQFLQPDADPHMPPEGKKQVTASEIEGLQDWIAKLPRPDGIRFSATNSAWVNGYVAEIRKLENAGDAPALSTPPHQAIDAILAADWAEQKITPAPLCDDATFVRRIYLDLAGRIPTAAERESFLASQEVKRRDALIGQLLESPEYSRHLREIFDVVLLGRPKGRNETARRDHGWFTYLEDSFRTNRPWNEMVREMILARSTDARTRGAAQFLYERRNNFQAMAEAVAPVAFGMQIGCAQCHNHPLSWEIEQRHYWGLVAAFNRSKNVDTSSGIALAESAIGGFVQFTNLKKESQPATLAFLNGRTVEEKRPGENEKEKDDPALYLVPPSGKEAKEGREAPKVEAAAVPKFSRREALADAVTTDNPRLARAFVNRMWQVLMGRGIVHPVDQMDSRHRPSHPLLLDWLAKDFERNGYDVKRLVRAIVESRVYQLDSKAPGQAPPVTSFARALDKPLSAEQLAASVLVASGHYPPSGEEANELRRAIVQKFPDFMPVVYNPSLDQALFWANSPVIDQLLKPKEGNAAAQLLAVDSAEQRVKRAFLMVLGREPDSAESAELATLGKAGTRENGVRNILWALLSSAEFQLNH